MNDVRILDLTRVLAGPWATQQLADQGADVIKIEPPGGDDTRAFGPIVDGQSTYFLSANRNKRSLVLDLLTKAGRDVMERLLATADVLVENYRPGVAARLGLEWEVLHGAHPRLVYVAIHAFGDTAAAEVTQRPGYDIVLQAMGGSAAITGLPGGPPFRTGTASADLMAGLLATQAVLLGLRHRDQTGEGSRLVVNMMQLQAAALTYHATRLTVAGETEVQRGNSHAGLVPYDLYRCADGWLALGCANDAMWQRLRTALGLPDRPEWARNLDRVARRAEVDAAVGAAIAQWTVSEADARLSAARIPVGPVLTPGQALSHPAVDCVEVTHPVLGPVRLPGPVLQGPDTRTEHRCPPLLAEHRDEILAELGYDTAAIHTLEASGAFGAISSAAPR